jgi:glycosyltransferase involved in cell wall biosynthesis
MSLRLCLTPRVHGVGGMVSFLHKFTSGLETRGIQATNDLSDAPYVSVLVIGGTRDLSGLWRAKRLGIPIVQRLNGMNWLHRKRKTGVRHALRSEYGNWLLNFIRTRLATHIVYQSAFAKGWWERVYGQAPVSSSVIFNGVDLDQYTPQGGHNRPTDLIRILLVEGSLQGGYEMGLETAVHLTQSLRPQTQSSLELMVVGKVFTEFQAVWDAKAGFPIQWMGQVPREQIPAIDRSAHLLYAGDINAACPNSVIEALACGLPVAAFDTGALPELVDSRAGGVVPYGGDPWILDPPDVEALAICAVSIIQAGEQMRQAARNRAEALFGLELMMEKYLAVLSA